MAGVGGGVDNPYGESLWELLPRPLKLLVRQGQDPEAWRWCMVAGSWLGELGGWMSRFVRNRHPATADDAALPELGRERWLPRLSGETLDEWRARLRRAFPLHQEGGTPAGVLRVLSILGFPAAEHVEYQSFIWNYDGRVSYDGSMTYGTPWGSWAHFSVALPGVYELASDVVARIVEAVNKVKAGHAKLFWIKGRHELVYDGSWTYDGRARFDGESIVLWEG